MRSWAMAHLYGTWYQAVVCLSGTAGEAAFRESLEPQYTSHRHDSKGLHTYYIQGTCNGVSISRIVNNRIGMKGSGGIGKEVIGVSEGPLCISITSNAAEWMHDDLSENQYLVRLKLDMARLSTIPAYFLRGCRNLTHIDVTSLHRLKVIPPGFLCGCGSLKEADLSHLVHVREIGEYFMVKCTSLTNIKLPRLPELTILPSVVSCRLQQPTASGFHSFCGSTKYRRWYSSWL